MKILLNIITIYISISLSWFMIYASNEWDWWWSSNNAPTIEIKEDSISNKDIPYEKIQIYKDQYTEMDNHPIDTGTTTPNNQTGDKNKTNITSWVDVPIKNMPLYSPWLWLLSALTIINSGLIVLVFFKRRSEIL